jgi:hypothetical protein
MTSDVGTSAVFFSRGDTAEPPERPKGPDGRSPGAVRRGRRRALLSREAGGDGFAILEVVIAFTMLIIILIPAAALFANVIKMSANSRDRVVAGNLAAQQIDVGRATSFGTLAAQADSGSLQTTTPKEGGITYKVVQSAAWVNESTNACGGTGNGSPGTQPILAMTETVTWPNMSSTFPIVAQTDIAPPAGYYSSSLGNLAIKVEDSNLAAVVGASVTITGPSPATTVAAGPITTGATGCAFAAFLAPGAYTATASLPGYVDMNENTTATKANMALGAGSTVGWTLNYAPAAQVPISYQSTAPVLPTTTTTLPTTTTTVAGPTTTTTSTSTTTTTLGGTTTTTTTVPFGTITYPTNGYQVTVNDTAYLTAPVTYAAPLAGALQLWPYANGYDIYPGGCADNDPATYSLYAPFSVSQGVTSPDTLQVYGVAITASSALGPVTSMQVVSATDVTCSTNNSFGPFASAAGNTTVIGVPLGTFSLHVTGIANGQAVSGNVTLPLENGTALSPQTVTLS